MKNNKSNTGRLKCGILLFTFGMVAGVLLVLLLQSGPSTPEPVESNEKNSFQQVTGRLNKGGALYFYLSTQQMVISIKERIAVLKGMLITGGNPAKNREKESEAIIKLLESLIINSGITETSGIGMSQITLANGLQHSKMILHHHKGKNEGLIWNLFKDKPHTMDCLNMLPSNTVLAGFTDCRIDYAWKWLKTQVGTSGLMPLQRVMVVWDSALKMQGITLADLLPSIDDQIGFVATMDPKNKMPLPGAAETILKLPRPSMALVLSVKDNQLFNVLTQMLRGPQGNAAPAANDGKFFLPFPGLPFQWKPVIAQHQGFLVIATDETIISEMWEAKKGGNRLTETKEFKALALDMPVKGNHFRYVNPLLMTTIRDLFKAGFSRFDSGASGYGYFDLLNPFPADLKVYSVLQNMEEGLVITANHNMPAHTFMMTPSLASIFVGTLFYSLYPDVPSTHAIDGPSDIPPQPVEKKARIN